MEKVDYAGAVIQFFGVVQGVGFRPFVFRNAHRFHLKGSVQNTDTGVLIKVDGEKRNITRFFEESRNNPPVLAEIHSSSLSYCEPHGYRSFDIIKSAETKSGFTPVSPDIATCSDCLSDISDHQNRRYKYPFTNCTNCGPRFTIIRDIPYDRKNTTMSVFPQCTECSVEYENPLDRRYHAQPNACALCGPRLRLIGNDGREVSGNPISQSLAMLEEGRIVAIKGLGGFHLAVLPQLERAVNLLRERKRRKGKPFALMVRNIDSAKKYCRVDARSEKLLGSIERPIVLLERLKVAPFLSSQVAPDTNLLGLMLPYTPLHHIIMQEGPEILVMTSANLSEEPLAFRDEDAFQRISGIADGFLTHNREIERPCDDSVFLRTGDVAVPIRRSRGFVPRSIDIERSRFQIFAAGASEKNTFCVLKEGKAYPSHHIGDLDNDRSVDAYIKGVYDFLDMFRIEPDGIACDLHPDYISTRFAGDLSREMDIPIFQIQHHHAHIASVLAERGARETVIGVALDGTGYGPDGSIWGGEFLTANRGEYKRVGHFAAVSMPGGEKCITETDRIALSYLIETFGLASDIPPFQFTENLDRVRLTLIESIIKRGKEGSSIHINCPLTSSCGRLFDAVSALLGLCHRPEYDAQGAILLENAAAPFNSLEAPYTYAIEDGILFFKEMIKEIVDDIRREKSVKNISQKFHSTIILSCMEMCKRIRDDTGLDTVALSGGVFQNRYITRFLIELLQKSGFQVLFHVLVPPNDGGISLGQGVVALNLMEGGEI